MRRNIFTLLLIVTAIGVLAPSAWMKTNDRKVSEHLREKTSIREYKFTIPKGKKARLVFKTSLNTGSVKLMLIDPEKDPRFGIRVSADKKISGQGHGVSSDLDFIAGSWSVVVKTTEATGEYEFVWELIDAD